MTNNCLIESTWIAREIWASFHPDAMAIVRERDNRDFDVEVHWNGERCRFPITLQQRTWSLHDIMEKIMRPNLIGLREGAT